VVANTVLFNPSNKSAFAAYDALRAYDELRAYEADVALAADTAADADVAYDADVTLFTVNKNVLALPLLKLIVGPLIDADIIAFGVNEAVAASLADVAYDELTAAEADTEYDELTATLALVAYDELKAYEDDSALEAVPLNDPVNPLTAVTLPLNTAGPIFVNVALLDTMNDPVTLMVLPTMLKFGLPVIELVVL
jgi:hypothetical protein